MWENFLPKKQYLALENSFPPWGESWRKVEAEG